PFRWNRNMLRHLLSGACSCRRTGTQPGSSPGQAFAGACASPKMSTISEVWRESATLSNFAAAPVPRVSKPLAGRVQFGRDGDEGVKASAALALQGSRRRGGGSMRSGQAARAWRRAATAFVAGSLAWSAPAQADTLLGALAQSYLVNPQLNSQRAIVRQT